MSNNNYSQLKNTWGGRTTVEGYKCIQCPNAPLFYLKNQSSIFDIFPDNTCGGITSTVASCPAPKNCEVSGWSSCKNNVQTRYVTNPIAPMFGGQPCPTDFSKSCGNCVSVGTDDSTCTNSTTPAVFPNAPNCAGSKTITTSYKNVEVPVNNSTDHPCIGVHVAPNTTRNCSYTCSGTDQTDYLASIVNYVLTNKVFSMQSKINLFSSNSALLAAYPGSDGEYISSFKQNPNTNNIYSDLMAYINTWYNNLMDTSSKCQYQNLQKYLNVKYSIPIPSSSIIPQNITSCPL